MLQQPVGLMTLPPSDQWDAAWIERVKRFTNDDICTLYRDVFALAGAYVLGAEAQGPESAAHKRVQEVVGKLLDLESHISLLNPTAILGTYGINMESQEHQEVTQAFWHSVTSVMGCTTSQVQEIRVGMRMYTQALAQARRERTELVGYLSTMEDGENTNVEGKGDSEVRDAGDISRLLQHNLLKELAARNTLRTYVTKVSLA